MKCLITFEVNLSALIPHVARAESELNNTMSEFGYHEQISIRTELPIAFTTNKPIENLPKLINSMLQELNEKHFHATHKNTKITP